jgi:hypothetical protein
MHMRRFVDDDFVRWEVVAVHPRASSQHLLYESVPDAERAEAGTASDGWLFFRSKSGEWRRLTPIPGDWLTASNAALAAHCRAAVFVAELPED